MEEIVLVPKDKWPLDVLAEMGERTKNAWIFFQANIVKKLVADADSCEKYPETKLLLMPFYKRWFFCNEIYANDISFRFPTKEPEQIIFLKMAE